MILKAAAVVTTVDSSALVELPVWVEPVLVLCAAAKKVLAPRAACNLAIQLGCKRHVGVSNDVRGNHAGGAGGVVLSVNLLALRVDVRTANEHTPSAKGIAAKVVGRQVRTSSGRQSDVAVGVNDNDLAVEKIGAQTCRVNQELTRSASIGHAVVTVYGT